METGGPTYSFQHFVGVGNGRLFHDPPNLFEESGIDESDASGAGADSDSFIFFLKNVIVLTQTSPDGSEESKYTALSLRRHEVPRADFAVDAERMARSMVLSSAEAASATPASELPLPSAEQIDALAEELASFALVANAEDDPMLSGPPSASGHRALPVFLLVCYVPLPDGWEDYERAVAESAGQGVSTVPAAASAIKALDLCAAPSSGKETCTVCLEDLDGEEDVARLPCSHLYHKICAVRWLETSNLCPLCRYAMPTEKETSSS